MTPVVELLGITKRFGPVEVLTDVDLGLHAGRVHSLAGENGAGKSTLVKILGGIHQPDSGRILIDGTEVALRGAADAQRHGIAVIHQHPTVFPDLSVAENVFVGRQPRRRGRIDWAAMRAEAEELLARLRMEIDVRVPVKMLGIAERQTIEIVSRPVAQRARAGHGRADLRDLQHARWTGCSRSSCGSSSRASRFCSSAISSMRSCASAMT